MLGAPEYILHGPCRRGQGLQLNMTQSQKAFVSIFQNVSAFLLFVTAAAKLVSAFGNQGILGVTDPILGIPNRLLLICVGLMELAVVGVLLSRRRLSFPLLFTAMLGGQFLLYRVILVKGGFPAGCPCLGTITQWLPVSDAAINSVLVLIAMWLCIGGLLSFYFSFIPAQDSRERMA
jgi:hypothetical protein